jgi:hypothetical protein
MNRFTAILLALVAFTASAQDPRNDHSRYEKVLIPLHTGFAAGAHGAAWRTQLVMRNEGAQPLDVFPLGRDCISSSTCFNSIREYPAFTGETTGIHLLGFQPFRVGDSDEASPGVFLYVERQGADRLSTQLHVADTTRRPLALGTRLPVVRENEFFTSNVEILAVPIVSGTRAALRIYNFESEAGASVMVRIYDTAPFFENNTFQQPRLLGEEVLQFSHDPSRDTCGFSFTECPAGYRFQPGHIEITDLLGRYPNIGLATPAAGTSNLGVRIAIIPLTPGLRFWPMVSVTENSTSVVSLYTAR